MDVTISSMVMENKVFTEVLSNLQLKQYKRDIHFNNSMSNLQMVEMKYMYTDWLKLLHDSVLKIHKFSNPDIQAALLKQASRQPLTFTFALTHLQ